MNQANQLKEYIKRLNAGESLESVQKDFREAFGSADASDIVAAEEILIQEGMPEAEVQKLCDVHSALFHQPQKMVLTKKSQHPHTHPHNPDMKSAALASETGHPLNVLSLENEQLQKRLNALQNQLDTDASDEELLASLQDLLVSGAHYDKKDELILPMLKRHGIGGPSVVMWNLDDELRSINKSLLKDPDREQIQSLIQRMKEMIFKEDKILFPLAEENFTEQEWQTIHHDMPIFGYSWISEIPVWTKEEKSEEPDVPASTREGLISLPTGTLSVEQLESMLDTLPMELTFIDENEINRYFSKGAHMFPRPLSALGGKVFDCHPPKAMPIVKKVLAQLKSGEKDMVSFVAHKKGRKVLVRYMAVRSPEGKYLGVLEVAEDITDIA